MPSPYNAPSPLAHVLWIGGAPDAGKSSIAQLLAEMYHLQRYHFDAWEAAHFGRSDPQQHPAMAAVSPTAMDSEHRWVRRPPALMAQQTIAAWTERFGMTVEDLLAMPRVPRIVAEGAGLFPELVAPLLATPHHALWLVPADTFKWDTARRRNKLAGWDNTSDPERARQQWFARDQLLAAHITQRAAERHLTVVELDGTQSLTAVAARVEKHFGSLGWAQERHADPV